MSSYSSLVELENLFIEKLQEKYKLNARDLKRAFSRFDIDGNGLLDLDELVTGFQLFLNGVKREKIAELISQYDINKDGKISYEELLQFLTLRNAIQPDSDYNVNAKSSARGRNRGYVKEKSNNNNGSNLYDNYSEQSINESDYSYKDSQSYVNSDLLQDYYPAKNPMKQSNVRSFNEDQPDDTLSEYQSSEVPSNIDITNPKELEYRAKIFLQNLKAFLIKKANDMRLAGKLKYPMTMRIAELHEKVARDIILKAFQNHMSTIEVSNRRSETIQGLVINDFARLLRSYTFPGASKIRSETIKFLFELCSISDDGETFVNQQEEPIATSNILVDLIFGSINNHHPAMRKPKSNNNANNNNLTSSMTLSNEEYNINNSIKGRGFAAKVDNGRQLVASGPVNPPSATDAKTERAADLLAVPLRFVSRKSHSVLSVPSSFDPIQMRRSNNPPSYSLV
eukprot:gene15669-21194_t